MPEAIYFFIVAFIVLNAIIGMVTYVASDRIASAPTASSSPSPTPSSS